jgi:hypothetical protein|uniref:Uncharacterized protein n=1 Tax=Attheya septentrionalis TaxID=420275 RepID=A0A7S2UG32_9STRA|mmetsp:Transcript_23835/g.43065  ORF Transcript_23835/g.43065 Transcript_23835/m.43065 type:complete len:180 (+) Transcript_23835:78-617(+)
MFFGGVERRTSQNVTTNAAPAVPPDEVEMTDVDDDEHTIIGMDDGDNGMSGARHRRGGGGDEENGEDDNEGGENGETNNLNDIMGLTGQQDAENETRRRNVIRREIRRVQRANFMYFVLLCLIPTSLLLIVVATVLGEEENCNAGIGIICSKEARSFVNAFTSRCICNAIVLTKGEDGR